MNARGMAMMALAMFLFSAVDTQGKFLTDTLHPVQIVWSRQMGLVLGVVILLAMRGAVILRTPRPGLQVLRGAMAAGSATMFIAGVSFVPLADAVALTFVAPFIVTVMGALILREPVGLRRWVAVTIGFVGTLIVIRPGMGVMHPAAFLVLGAAALFAFRQILSRYLAATDNVVTTVAYTAIVSAALLTFPLPWVWVTPETWTEIALLCSMAVLAALAETLVIKSLQIAQTVAVAPIQYTILIWSTFYGFVVFGDFPDSWTWLGAAIIVATGVYTIHRERLAERRKRA